jgi:(1->4)-alpha-D-glucan 1-alpha-D-glucosylmutase
VTESAPIVRATYRVQLHSGFTFKALVDQLDYLKALGIDHVYCSPYLQAAPGSTHGYDVLDHTRINDELGGQRGHQQMCTRLAELGMGHIVDIVPNHMAISGQDNRWWWDVLKNGPLSEFAHYFDIDWVSPEPRLRYTILMPILHDHYGRVLQAGDVVLEHTGGETVVRYLDHYLPVSPESIAFIESKFEEIDESSLGKINADRELLHEVLDRQHYRLAFWRTAARELGYRRFFDINTLVGLRTEDEGVFNETHGLILGLVDEGRVNGLRIDHIDGLLDPQSYLQRLRERLGDRYLVVEKILEPGEHLPDEWPVDGTTGYDFANVVGGLFIDPAGEAELSEAYNTFLGHTVDIDDLTRQSKMLIEQEILASDVERLVQLLVDICEARLDYRDYTRWEIREVTRELCAAFPVYRTYVAVDREVSETDRLRIDQATKRATARRSDLDAELFDFVRRILLLEETGHAETEFALRFQQTTAPVMAKSVEDTLFYNYNRLASLCDVGSDPARFGTSLEEFHADMARRSKECPRSMLATSTHDSKRSEDVRARLALLSEIPDRWSASVARWSALNERHRTGALPDRNAEYLFYQTLVGAFPLQIDRAITYMEKASKEAKRYTSWVSPDPAYDEALRRFVTNALSSDRFLADVEAFVAPLVHPGRVNSLAQLAIKLTAPGVPDTYQGTETWDLSLVDPDNRRPVDYEARRRLLETAVSTTPREAWAQADSGLPKMLLLNRLLRLRAERPEIFEGSYEAVQVHGSRGDNVIAFERAGTLLTIAPRLSTHLQSGWGDTRIALPEGTWVCALGGSSSNSGTASMNELLAGFPVGVLVRAEES